jgi:hypothetical protein
MRRVFTAALFLVWAADAEAQRIIYDAKRDATAQETAAAAKEVTSGALFAAMLRNVDAQAKLEVDTETAFIQERMRAKLNAFEWWHNPNALPNQFPKPGVPFSPTAFALCQRSVECQLATLRQQHQDALAAKPLPDEELNKRLAAIQDRRVALQAELKKLRDASKSTDPFIVRAFEALEDPGGDILAYAQKIVEFAKASPTAKGIGKALTSIEEGLDQVLALYKAIESIWRGQQAVSVDPASLRPPPQQIELQLLEVEQAHLKTVARITARMHLEVGVALSGVQTAGARLEPVLARVSKSLGPSPRPIEATLREAAASHDRQALLEQWLALHEAASAIAQLDAAEALAAFRLSDEARRYSIRRSAVNISTYDLTIQAAVQRLALYWKGGIKPTELAQFVFYVTNSIALPAIAIKQE